MQLPSYIICHKKNNKILETLQNRCLRIITLAEPQTPSNSIRKQLNIPSLENRRTYLFLCECFTFFKGISPNIDVIAIQNDQHDQLHNLRSVTASNLPIPRMNKTVGQRALAYLEPRTFNTLPNHIKTSITLPIFKTQLRKYLLL